MNRQEAFETMKQGRYVTHPKLNELGIGPLYLVDSIIYGNHDEPLNAQWKEQIDSEVFNDNWIAL